MKWLKQIFFKRLVFNTMLKQAMYVEVQSIHVQNNISDFIDISNKKFFIKSDINFFESELCKPKNYEFSKKIKFLYIVGPHFEYLHKNFEDFVKGMVKLKKNKFDFEIVVTLTKEQLNNSKLWDKYLDNQTVCLGYIPKDDIEKQFEDNTILISTSVIETLGLHVIEAIQNGILAIVPNEVYSKSVYGNDTLIYKLFDVESLVNKIDEITLLANNDIKDIILKNQHYLIKNETKKYKNVLDIFDKIIKVENVQK
ncbi:glycosyltransferase [Sulfurimonas sp. CS5]|uniref:glycosyltransferase n=1 Tax=Sulfurimonas sp. CS5 TaxID=3391145 RepID=UPI0039ECB314